MTAACPRCGGPVAPDDAFCGSCGARLDGAQARAATTQPGAATQAQPYATPATTPTRKGGAGRTVAIGCVVLVLLSLCGCLGAGAILYLTGSRGELSVPWFPTVPSVAPTSPAGEAPDAAGPGEEAPATTRPGTATPGATPPGSSGSGAKRTYPTPLAALKAGMPKGWVYRLAHDKPQQKEYWVGPPASEWTDVYLVEPTPDGRWVVKESYPFEVVPGP